MEIKVVEEKDNKYLDRKEIRIHIYHPKEATPKKLDILKYIVDRFSLDPNKTILMCIKTFYGENRSEALIYYYPDGIDWSTIEPPKRKKVIKIGEEKSEKEG